MYFTNMQTKTFIEIRKGLGWSQRQLAKKLGIDPTQVHRIERGSSIPLLMESKMNEYKCVANKIKKIDAKGD